VTASRAERVFPRAAARFDQSSMRAFAARPGGGHVRTVINGCAGQRT
jgi:hypothetical protein